MAADGPMFVGGRFRMDGQYLLWMQIAVTCRSDGLFVGLYVLRHTSRIPRTVHLLHPKLVVMSLPFIHIQKICADWHPDQINPSRAMPFCEGRVRFTSTKSGALSICVVPVLFFKLQAVGSLADHYHEPSTFKSSSSLRFGELSFGGRVSYGFNSFGGFCMTAE